MVRIPPISGDMVVSWWGLEVCSMKLMKSYEILWISMNSYEFLWTSMKSYEFLWIPMISYELQWIPMISYELQWNPMIFYEILWDIWNSINLKMSRQVTPGEQQPVLVPCAGAVALEATLGGAINGDNGDVKSTSDIWFIAGS